MHAVAQSTVSVHAHKSSSVTVLLPALDMKGQFKSTRLKSVSVHELTIAEPVLAEFVRVFHYKSSQLDHSSTRFAVPGSNCQREARELHDPYGPSPKTFLG